MPQYYPALSKLIQTDRIPEPLKQPITNIIDKLFYKGYFVDKSVHGDVAYYNIILVINNELGLNLFGGEEGFELLFNSGTVVNTTEIPIALYYNLPILKYVKGLNTSQLSEPKDYFDIIQKMLNISRERILFESICQFFDGEINTFINHYNTNSEYSTFPQLNSNYLGNDYEIISQITEQLNNDGVDIYLYIIEEIIAVENDISASFENLYDLFRAFLGEFTFEKILKLFIPKFSASIQQLELALAFPRTWLQPVDANGEVIQDENIKSLLRYNAGSLSYHSEKGFEFDQLDSFDLDRSQIGNTGLIIEIQNLKFDFRTDKNIPEAIADGRPDSFKGVYVQYAAVTLPPNWFNDDEVVGGITAKVAGYNLLIGTGGISGTVALETQTFRNTDGTIVNYYTDYFQFQYPIQTTHKDVSNNLVITDITNHTALKNQLETHEATQFIFPLSLTKVGETEPTVYENVSEYYSYLNTLYDTSDENNKPRLSKRFGDNGFEIWFTSFDMTFQQGHIVESNIQGGIKVPRLKDSLGNDAEIDIFGHLDDDGGFNVTASEQDGFQPISIPEVLDITIKSLEVGRESNDDPFYIGTACDIVFTNEVIRSFIGDQVIPIERLRIYSDGSFEIVGGAISVPTNFTLNLGPVEVSITGINFGSYQAEDDNGVIRKYNYFGFDGGISLGSIGVEARGEGVKYFYTVDDGPKHSFIKIETIEVDLTIPGNASASSATAIIKGWLSINEIEYAGGVSLKLPKLKMAGGADMRLQPKHPAFIIDAYLDIPIPIPLAATGLGITGFRGLAGFRYVAEKEAVGLHSHDDKWYDYYTYPPRGVHVSKFNGPDKTENFTNPVSLGAGVTVATMSGSNVISLRVMVLLSIPNMLLIDGRASILSEQWGLDDTGEPPFFAFMILAENGIEVGAGADFKLPGTSGDIIDLHAYMQAGYFWDNPSGWYLNLGTKSDPITAKVLKLVDMESFLMLSASGIEAGAKVSFDIDESFGPIRVKAWLLAEVGGYISFERPQIGGYMTVDAGARVDLFGIITVGVSFYVHFAVEAAKPFLIYAEIRVCGRIKIAFVKIKICAQVKIKWEKSREVDRSPVAPIPQELRDQAVKGIHMLTGETFELIDFGSSIPDANSSLFDNAIIPLDTYVDIKFDKAVLPGDIAGDGGIGSYNNPPENYEDLIPPVKVIKGNELRQVKHRYQITDIKIKAAKDGATTWVDYHPYESVVNSTDRDNVDHLRIGHWQKSSKEYNAIRLLATSPFSYTEQGEPGWFIPEQLGLTHSSFFCEGQQKLPKCANWLQKELNTQYNTVTYFPYYHSHQEVFFNISQGLSSTINGVVMNSNAVVVTKPNSFGYSKSLEFPNSSTLEFKLPQPSTEVKLTLSTNAQSLKVIYYKSFLPEGEYLMQYDVIESVNYSNTQLNSIISYINEDTPVSKIEIIPQNTNQSQIDAIYEQIEQLFNDTYEQLGNNIPEDVNVEVPLDAQAYYSLLNQLEQIQNQSCSILNDDCIKDEVLCNLYGSLSEIFPVSFPSQIESINEINEYLNTYGVFIELIYSQLTEEYINNNLQPEINDYRTLLEDIIANEGNEDYIPRYYQLRELAELIYNRINFLGNCDCTQNNNCNDQDEAVCSLYDEINTLYVNCLQPTDNIEQINQNLDCANQFESIIKRFAGDNPQYDLINYLSQNLDYYTNAYLVIYNNPQNGNLNDEEILDLYNNTLIIYGQVIINLISQLGNCNCENLPEPEISCSTLLHSICWLSVEDWFYNQNIPSQEAIQEDYEATIEAINNIVDPIWRPNTKYYVEFTVKDIVDDTDSHPPYKYYYGFKTAGTIGHYHNAPNVVYGNEYDPETQEILNRNDNGKLINPSQYALTSLEQYIDYRRSYPNADGNLLQSKPLFYSNEQARLLLFYIKPYVKHMLKDQWEAYGGTNDDYLPLQSNSDGIQALKVFIQDPVSNVIMEHPMPPEIDTTNIPQTIETWEEDEEPPMPIVLQFFQNFVEAQGGDCSFISGDVIRPASQYSVITLHNLKPRKMYTAIINNTFNDISEQIHSYVFQTSRYSSFDEQVNSYVLERDENDTPLTKAIFNLNLDLNTQLIDAAYDILDNQSATNDIQESQYLDFLDRIIEGVFRLVPLDPPATTEFNLIRNQNNNDIVAILIRNPEPFNDPKIPLEFIEDTIQVTENTDDYKVLYSKDYSQALIMHSSKKITSNSLSVRFRYKLWNGYVYAAQGSPILVEDLVLNPEN